LKVFEENKMAIVEDEVAQESRQFRTLVEENTGNPIRALAKYLGDIEGDSILFDPDKKRTDMRCADRFSFRSGFYSSRQFFNRASIPLT